MQIRYCTYTDTGDRPVNEDRLCACRTPAGCCFAVADGLGGHACGEVASRLAVDILCGEGLDTVPGQAQLLERFQAANARILEQQKQPGQEDMERGISVQISVTGKLRDTMGSIIPFLPGI